jgi:hypothetical protein
MGYSYQMPTYDTSGYTGMGAVNYNPTAYMQTWQNPIFSVFDSTFGSAFNFGGGDYTDYGNTDYSFMSY